MTDRLAVNFGAELTRIVPGRVSTEVDADLSFDTEAHDRQGRDADRRLRRAAASAASASSSRSPRPGKARKPPQCCSSEGIDCNLTLLFSLAQAIACADASAFLISPFVGRILDWHVKAGGGPYTAETDPGVVSVRSIYAYYKTYGIKTVVMGASFRNTGEIEALAGCDRLTISPQLLDELAKDEGPLPRRLDPTAPGQAPEKHHARREALPLDAQRGRDGDGEARRRHPRLRQGPGGPARNHRTDSSPRLGGVAPSPARGRRWREAPDEASREGGRLPHAIDPRYAYETPTLLPCSLIRLLARERRADAARAEALVFERRPQLNACARRCVSRKSQESRDTAFDPERGTFRHGGATNLTSTPPWVRYAAARDGTGYHFQRTELGFTWVPSGATNVSSSDLHS